MGVVKYMLAGFGWTCISAGWMASKPSASGRQLFLNQLLARGEWNWALLERGSGPGEQNKCYTLCWSETVAAKWLAGRAGSRMRQGDYVLE